MIKLLNTTIHMHLGTFMAQQVIISSYQWQLINVIQLKIQVKSIYLFIFYIYLEKHTNKI